MLKYSCENSHLFANHCKPSNCEQSPVNKNPDLISCRQSFQDQLVLEENKFIS